MYVVFRIPLWGMSIEFEDHCYSLTWREAELEMAIVECTEGCIFLSWFSHGLANVVVWWKWLDNLKTLEHKYSGHS